MKASWFLFLFLGLGAGIAAQQSAGEPASFSEKTVQCWTTWSEHKNAVLALAFSPDGQRLASVSADSTVRVWKVKENRVLYSIPHEGGWILSLAYAPNGKTLAGGCDAQDVHIFDAETGKSLQTLHFWKIRGEKPFTKKIVAYDGPVGALCFTPDGFFLATGCDDKVIRLLTTSNYRPTDTWEMPGKPEYENNRVRALAFCPPAWIAAGGDDGIVKVWSIEEGNRVYEFAGHTGQVRTIAVSSDGTYLASGSDDHTIHIWELHTGRLTQTLTSHTHYVRALSFSPDNRLLASASWDSTIRLWDPQTGALLKTLEGHTLGINALCFSPDGRLLVSGSNDNTIKLWASP